MFPNRRSNRIQRMISLGMLTQVTEGGDGGSGGVEDDEVKTFTQADIDAAIAKANEGSSGLKTKNEQLLQTIADNKRALASIDGVDVPELLALKQKIANDEILSLLAAGKSSEALERHTERLTLTHNSEVTGLNERLSASEKASATDRTQLHGLLIDGEAMKSFVAAKGVETAIPDIILRAKQIFKVERDEATGENVVAARDAKGNLIQGEKGNLTFEEWAISLKETAPHLFPASESGYGRNGKGGEDKGGDAELLAAAEKGPEALRELKRKRKERASR